MQVVTQTSIVDGPLVGRSLQIKLSKSGKLEELFAYVPSEHGNELSQRDDIFVPALVMAALVNGEDLDLGGMRADPMLMRNCLSAALQHKEWVPRFKVPAVTNWVTDPAPRPTETRLALFFSGGIDSLFTLTRHSAAFPDEPTRLSPENISLALHVFHTGDSTLVARNTFAENNLGASAKSLGADFVPVFSNIMSFNAEWYQHYTRVTHSAGLASIARLLSRNLSGTFIASSSNYGDLLSAWGSSPIVDPLYSGRDMVFIDDGSTFTRFEKTEFISGLPAALAVINVCDRLDEAQGYVNCSRCQKCLRTMAALDLCGVSGAASPAFVWTDYTPQSYGKIYLKSWAERCFAVELSEAAAARGRQDIVRAIRSGMSRSMILWPMSELEDRFRHTSAARKGKDVLTKLRAVAYGALGLRR